MPKDHTIPTPAAAELPKDDSIIHTMPKKFVTAHPSTHDHKSMGILILAVGLVVLCAGLGGLYYFLKQSNSLGGKTVETASEAAPAPEQPAAVPAATDNQARITQTPPTATPTATTTDDIMPVATEETATATDIIHDDSATTTAVEDAATATTTAPDQITTDADADGDGLTDLEEALLNTNPAVVDSDSDGYNDLAELQGMYNPAGSGKLIVNSAIEKYTNPKFGYSLYYPKYWNITSLTEEDSVIFQLSNGQFMQVIVQPNIEKQTIEEWYKKQFGEYSLQPGQMILKAGWTGIMSDDGLVYYLINPNDDNIYTLNYSLGITNTVSYRNVFDVMVMSLELK